MTHKSGFVSIIGKPNAGKSTLTNALLGEKLSIVTHKAQTTRQRILGFLNDENYQIILTDTPGIMQPKYKLQETMMTRVEESLQDSDVVIFVSDTFEKWGEEHEIIQKLKKIKQPILVALNKVDLSSQEKVMEQMNSLEQLIHPNVIIPISAIEKYNLDKLLAGILNLLPDHPPYYSKKEFTDRTERFLVAEIIREKIFLLFHEEIPYSTEVIINEFAVKEKLIKIAAEIFVNKKSQKSILIGKGGLAIKNLGTYARVDIEKFLNKKVFLELRIKEQEGWRENEIILKKLGY